MPTNENTILFAKNARKLCIKMVYQAKASHIGGALSMIDILAVLYNNILKIDPSNNKSPDRDRFFLSKGHACTALYATLAMKGFFSVEELDTYAQDGSIFLSHTNHHIPGVEISAGSLGHALPVCCGTAIAGKLKKSNWRSFCLISDGELNEGSNWETILFAPQHRLDNLVLIVDYNKIQSMGFTKDIIELNPLNDKFNAFGWETFEVDGHDHDALTNVFIKTKIHNDKPKVVIAHTVKGKGISFMENKIAWHYKSPSEEQLREAITELDHENSIY